MPLSNAELLAIKAELTNDPLNLGLTTLPENDEANADKLNLVRESVRVYRASVPADDILIPVDEWNGLSEGQRSWWNNQTQDGSVKPSVMADEFFKLFASGTESRANFDAVSTESSSRAIQLLGRYVYLTPSDVSQARQAT